MRLPSFCTFLLAFAVWTTHVSAQETFAPLITESTILFVHADFRNVEIDTLKENWTEYAEDFLKRLRFDDRSVQATLAALGQDLDRLDALIRPTFEAITWQFGIREFALIVDADLIALDAPAIIAVPWNNKTDEDFEQITSMVSENLSRFSPVFFPFPRPGRRGGDIFPAGEFLFFGQANEGTINRWLDDATPGNAVIAEALASLDDDIKIVAALPESVRSELLTNVSRGMEEPFLSFFDHAIRRVKWAAMSFPNPLLLAGEQEPLKLTIKTTSPDDALQIRVLMDVAINRTIAMWQTSAAEQRQRWGAPEIPLTLFEFARGYLRTMLPVIERDKLVFQQPEITPIIELWAQVTLAPMASFMFSEMFRRPFGGPMAGTFAPARTSCQNNLRQIVLALHIYHDVRGAFPPLYTVDAEGKPLYSWRVLILPFIEQPSLWDEILTASNNLTEPWDSENMRRFHDRMPAIFGCPSNPDAGAVYSVIAGEGFVPATIARAQAGRNLGHITDGTSNTIAIIEVKEPFNWMDPTADITLEELLEGINADGRVGSNHPGGVNAALFDGSVRFFPNDIPMEVLRIWAMPNSGQTIPQEWNLR